MLGRDQPAVAAVHQHQRRLVIGHVGVHRADDADVVDALGACAANSSLTSMPLWPYLLELERRAEAPRRSCARCGGSGAAAACRAYFASSGLGSKVSTCDGPPFMNRWMTRLALRGEVRRPRGQRVDRIGERGGGQQAGVAQQAAEAERAEADAAAGQEVAAGEGAGSRTWTTSCHQHVLLPQPCRTLLYHAIRPADGGTVRWRAIDFGLHRRIRRCGF